MATVKRSPARQTGSRGGSRRRTQRSNGLSRGQMMAIVAALASLSVVVLIALGALGRGHDTPIAPHVSVGDGRTLGADTAPVTLQVWEDYQCSFCKEVN